MRDKRPVDELSIEELERILAIRKREARMQQMERMKRDGRVVVDTRKPKVAPETSAVPAQSTHPPVGAERVQPKSQLPAESVGAQTIAPLQTPPPVGAERILPASPLQSPAKPVDPQVVRFDDEDEPVPAAPRRTEPKAASGDNRRWFNRALLGVEIAAVIGIIFIGINLFGAVGTLERETAAAQELAAEQRLAGIPTLAPTPTIRWENIVLPTGHIYSESGIVEFNLNEIPANLRPVVQSQLLQPVLDRPEPTAETAQRLVIPKLDIDQVIVPGVDPEALRLGIGQLINGVDPNDREGNLVLAAHNDIYGSLFRHLDQLEPGDSFTVYTDIQAHEYVVASVEIVEPNDVWVMENQPGRAMVTLISCYPYQVNTQRIIVFADHVS
ncbi:MAG: sortase [Chloroflexota bacterium]|nr:sortase [Chloroflexota bacterium]